LRLTHQCRFASHRLTAGFATLASLVDAADLASRAAEAAVERASTTVTDRAAQPGRVRIVRASEGFARREDLTLTAHAIRGDVGTVRLAVDLDRILTPTIEHRAAAVRFQAATGSQIGASLRFTGRDVCGVGYAAVARYAAATASLGSFAAATLDDAATAVSYRAAFAVVASRPAVVARVRIDAVAAARSGVDLAAVCTRCTGCPVLELVTRGYDLGSAGAGHGKPGEQNERGTSET